MARDNGHVEPNLERIELRKLYTDLRPSVRATLHRATIQQYVEDLDKLPPIDVFKVDGKYQVASGFHRTEAHRSVAKARAEERTKQHGAGGVSRTSWIRHLVAVHPVPALVHKGGRKAALRFALTANREHGRQLSRADKWFAILTSKEVDPDLSLRDRAKLIGVSHQTVDNTLKADEARRAYTGIVDNCQSLTRKDWYGVAKLDELEREAAVRELVRQRTRNETDEEAALRRAVEALNELRTHDPRKVAEALAAADPNTRTFVDIAVTHLQEVLEGAEARPAPRGASSEAGGKPPEEELRTCAYLPCDERFRPRNARDRFHSTECHWEHSVDERAATSEVW